MGIRSTSSTGRVAAVFAALALLTGGAGCGSGGGDEQRPSAAHKQAVPRTDAGIARAVLLGVDDLRAEWKTLKPTPPPDCGRLRTGWERAAATTASPAFKIKAGYTNVQQNVAIFDSERRARAVYAALRSKAARRCFYSALLVGVRTGGGQGNITPPRAIRAEVEPGPVNATRFVVRADSVLGRVSVYADQVRVHVGRLLTVLVLVDVNHPIDEDVYEAIVETVRRRSAALQRAAA